MNIVIMLVFLFGSEAINPDGPIVVRDYVNCVTELIRISFIRPGLLIFPHSVNSTNTVSRIRADVLKRIHDLNKYTIQITGPDTKATCNENPKKKFKVVNRDPFKVVSIANYFVIIVDSYTEFTHIARKLIRSRFWDPYAKFLVLLYPSIRNNYEILKEIETMLSCLFHHNVVKVIVMAPQAETLREALIYSWLPYDPPNYCGYYNESAKDRVLIENVCTQGVVKHKDTIFKDKLPSNMHGCTIYALAIERQPFVSRRNDDPNIEISLIKSLLRRSNLSINFEFLNVYRGERDEKGVWDGGLKELVARKGQILLGGIYPDFDVHEDFECSSTYLADSYTWVVPRALPSPAWSSLTAVYEKTVWYLAIVVFIVCVFTWKILGQLSGDTMYNSTFNHCFLNSWITMFGFPAYAYPHKISTRVFFVVFNLYCILFMTAYQSKLINVLRFPTFGYQIKSMQDLVESGLKYGGFEELHDLFHNSSDPFEYLIHENWINVHNISKALLDVAVHRNFSVICSQLELAYVSAVLPDLSDQFGQNNYYAFENSMFLVPLEIVGLKGFPFMKKLSHILNLYKQLGLNERLRRTFANINKRKRESVLRNHKIKGSFLGSLSIFQLQSGFFVLGLGMVGGIIILLMESILYKVKVHYF